MDLAASSPETAAMGRLSAGMAGKAVVLLCALFVAGSAAQKKCNDRAAPGAPALVKALVRDDKSVEVGRRSHARLHACAV